MYIQASQTIQNFMQVMYYGCCFLCDNFFRIKVLDDQIDACYCNDGNR